MGDTTCYGSARLGLREDVQLQAAGCLHLDELRAPGSPL